MKAMKHQIVEFQNNSASNSATLNSTTLKATTLNSAASLIKKELLWQLNIIAVVGMCYFTTAK